MAIEDDIAFFETVPTLAVLGKLQLVHDIIAEAALREEARWKEAGAEVSLGARA